MMFFGFSLPNVSSLSAPLTCISMTNQEYKVIPQIVNVNSDETAFYPFSIKTSKCSSKCNNVNDPYMQRCVFLMLLKTQMLKCSI